MRRLLVALALATACYGGEGGGQLRLTMRSDPKTFDPALVEDEPSDMVRYLTGGFLIRRNRLTQELEGELATSWRISERGRRIDFHLRPQVRFSDGTPFTCDDVVFTLRRALDPALHAPIADTLRTAPGALVTNCAGDGLMVRFPGPVAALADQFDGIAIQSGRANGAKASLGAFVVGEYKAGISLTLDRNPQYWKTDAKGQRLPYLNSIHFDIQQNRDAQFMRFRRGELDAIDRLDPDRFDELAAENAGAAKDAGPSLDWEVLFFNQAAKAALPPFKRRWFESTGFRKAISEALNRADLCRIAFKGHAVPAAGPVSVSNRFWYNTAIASPAFSPTAALSRLAKEGFHKAGDGLVDRDGNRVEFSVIISSGNRVHARMLSLMQQDLGQIGIRVNVVPLDFSAIVERISRSYAYEACLMNFTSVEIDPNSQKNIWVSSAANHQWNPEEKAPATEWEKRVDWLMLAQTQAQDKPQRKTYFDEVQQIVSEQAPFIYLVSSNALSAVSPHLKNVAPVALWPGVIWNAERLYLEPKMVSKR